jgi:hypothetical protein
MFYTNGMKRAVHSITPPKNFGVSIAEHSYEGTLLFIEVIADGLAFSRLGDTEKREAVEYMVKVKKALEDQGTVVQITRTELGNDEY